MKHISPYLLISVGLLFTIQTHAQTPRKVIVEHFTNTRCGICGSRNPGLFTNLSSSPDVMHMAVHPSRPYASCVLNQHNPTESDDRAKYYGIFGGTPRVVVQGEAKPVSQNFGAKSLYSDELGDSLVETSCRIFSIHRLKTKSMELICIKDKRILFPLGSKLRDE